LSDARTGAQVWSKVFSSIASDTNSLIAQDTVSATASAMIGSYFGAIGAAEYKRIQQKSVAELSPYECIVQSVIGTGIDATVAEPVARARDCLEHLTRAEPGKATAWAALVLVFNAQRNYGLGLPPEQAANVEERFYLADKAVEAANRAVAIAPADAFVRGFVARAAGMACQFDQVHMRRCERSLSIRMTRRSSVRLATCSPFPVFGTRVLPWPKRLSP
jgi:hypothetical protein